MAKWQCDVLLADGFYDLSLLWHVYAVARMQSLAYSASTSQVGLVVDVPADMRVLRGNCCWFAFAFAFAF
jgi:hypothetical protein